MMRSTDATDSQGTIDLTVLHQVPPGDTILRIAPLDILGQVERHIA